MVQYPITQIDKGVWNKKVNCTSMYTIPAEDEAKPVLVEIQQILLRLINYPVEETLGEDVVQYFFVSVFPVVCQKVIRSRYFKSNVVLKLANSILENSIYLLHKYLDIGVKYPKFLEVLMIVFSTDEFYFKNNNQLNYIENPLLYFKSSNDFGSTLKVGDYVDVLKTVNSSDKVSWSRGQVINLSDDELQIQYLYDCYDKKVVLKTDSSLLAPYQSKTKNFDWRLSLKEGDLVDCEDGFGNWYNSTVTKVIDKGQNKKLIKITMKVYHENGTKLDQNGKFYGFSDFQETVDATSPKLQPYCFVAKQLTYQSSKSIYDSIEDTNDGEFEEINGQKIYAFPRKKHLSEFMFKTINSFGKLKGFDIILDFLEKEINFDILCFFIKGISGITPYLHRNFVKDLISRLKVVIEKHIFGQPQKMAKEFTKQKSEMIFSGLRSLQKRVYNNDIVYEYENIIKMKLVDSCLQSESLKKKLQGLNELKDIVKSVIYTTQRNRWIKTWVKQNKIFEKIYLVNSHVQLIKKSEEFFKYLINEKILQVNDLERLYKMAQKGDYESRISLYKLFQEVSHIFQREHVEYLIDTILESDLNLVLNEDIDLLHELSRYSNYFPLKKVIKFFQNIILGDTKVKELNDYAIKKYSEIVARNLDMKSHRRDIIRNFLSKLTTHDISQVTKVLKGIFEGIGIGQWGKKQLNDILAEENVDEISIQAIKSHKGKAEFNKIVSNILQFLLSIFKLSFRVKIKVTTLISIWDQLSGNEEKEYEFYQWANNVLKCDQGLDDEGINEEFEEFYRKLFSLSKIKEIKEHQFDLAKSLFVEINKKNKVFTVSNTIKDREVTKQYKRKVSLKEIKLIDVLSGIILNAEDQSIVNSALNFFMEFYTSKDNSQEEIQFFLEQLLKDLKKYFQEKDEKKIGSTLKLIQILIDDSQKSNEASIESLLSQKKSQSARFLIINELSYVSDSVKKTHIDFPLNTTLMNLRKRLSKQFNIPWKQIKVVANKQLREHENSRTLKQLQLNPNQPITISRKVLSSHQQIELMPGDKMNPKAVRCFSVIFEKYSTNELMDKDQCNSFTAVCLGTPSTTKYYSEKITGLYNTYDEDKDGFLKFQQFIKFYEDAARDRPSTVWSNLRSFGVKNNLRFIDDPEEEVPVQIFPRKLISESKQTYEMLFSMLKNSSLAYLSFELLQRLPIYTQIEESLLNIEKESDLRNILQVEDAYTLFYKLNVMETLLYSSEVSKQKMENQDEKCWKKLFIKCHGYEILLETIQKLLKKQNFNLDQEIHKEILTTSFNSLIQYWVQCFTRSEKINESLGLLVSDFEIDEKIQYLVTGSFPKKQQKLQPFKVDNIENIEMIWQGPSNKEISQILLHLLNILWEKISQQLETLNKKETNIYSTEVLIDKIFFILNIFYINEDPEKLSRKLSELLEKLPLSRMVCKIYTLILCLCFYSENKYQGLYIKEMFRNLTKSNITFEHFRVLAVLVSKFGISGSGEDSSASLQVEESDKMRQVLLQNVLNNSNELTIEGCGKLLCNFKLNNVPIQSFYDIWSKRLFNPATICKKQQTKATLYELIIKIAQSNPQYIDQIIETVQDTIENKSKKMKITYCNQFKERSTNGFAGLKNLANTCYMNSVIQQMFMNKTFRYLLLRINDKKAPENIEVLDKEVVRTVDDNLLHQIQRIFAYLQKTNRIDFIPRDFCVAYKPFGQSVNIMIQQDVQEFVSMFFDRLQSCISSTPLKMIVQDFYTGKTANLFSCHECKKTKKVQQAFHSITLEVKNSKTLAQSFNRYILGELINDYKCDFCEKKVDVTKRTRIVKTPKVLIIHLQRIVFNLQTFINEKISSKHQFPHDFNLHPYTLDYFDRSQGGQTDITHDKAYEYSLIGIICHTGNAEGGHYISYLKTQNNKWYQFNDSLINVFNTSNIQSECFGGYHSTYDDDYDWDRKQNSKSAYLLLYERQGQNNIELILKNLKEKQAILKQLQLQQIISKAQNAENAQKNESNPTQSQEESSQIPEDSEKEAKELLAIKELQIKRSQSQDNIEVPVAQNKVVDSEGKEEFVIKVKDQIHQFISGQLREQVEADNVIHFFEKSLSSPAFSQFFAKLISLEHDKHKQLLPLCQNLTFGFWLKSPSFKVLLSMIGDLISHYPAGFTKIILQNPVIINLLIQSSDAEVRTNMASFLAKKISDVIEKQNLDLLSDCEENNSIVKFLDHLFDLLPSTVSKCWTKFTQYFQFWHEFSNRGDVQVSYMIRKELVKHFMDYFLDTKSPLKIYATKRQHTIGSSYTSPNFSMLLRCVSNLIQKSLFFENRTISRDQEVLLMSCESFEKLIADKYEFIASQLVKQVCPHNLPASERIAFVLLKGFTKSNYESIQPYLQVLHEYVLIEDEYQDLRIKWALGKETLAVSTYSKKVVALNSYSFEERIHNFDSTLYIQGGTSLLEMLFVYYKKIENFSMLCLKEILRLCEESEKLRKFIFSLSAPTLSLSKYSDFFKGFISRYLQDSKRVYGFYSSSGFNKEELAKATEEIYLKVEAKLMQDHKLEEIQRRLKHKSSSKSKQREKQKRQEEPESKKQIEAEEKQEQKRQDKLEQKQETKPEQEQKEQEKDEEKVHQQKKQDNEEKEQEKQEVKEEVEGEGEDKKEEKGKETEEVKGQPNEEPKKQEESAEKMHQEDNWYNENENEAPKEKVQRNYVKRRERHAGYDQYYDQDDYEGYGESEEEKSSDKEGNHNSKEFTEDYEIHVVQAQDEYIANDNERQFMNLTSQEEQPLIKTTESTSQFPQTWHPVKFEYEPLNNYEQQNLHVFYHESSITYLLTKPTGLSNRSFSSAVNVQKLSERMEPETWNNKKIELVKGYFFKNETRDYYRIQTDQGCQVCKPNDSSWIWTTEIKKIWTSQRTIDWPKWKLYSHQNEQQ